MKISNIALLALLLFSPTHLLFSQGEFTGQRRNSAYGIHASFAGSKETVGIGPAVSFSALGVVDFSVGYAWNVAQSPTPGINNISTAFSFGLAVHPLKASETNPVTLSALAGFQSHRFNIQSLETNESFSSWLYGPAIHLALRSTQSVYVQLSGAVLFVSQSASTISFSPPAVSRIVALSLPLVFDRETRIFVVGPSVSISSGSTTYGLSFEFIGLL